MKRIDPGHVYEFDNVESGTQRILFIKKELAEGEPAGTLTTVHDGTTTEEVISVLIDRLQTVNGRTPCRENALAITKMQEALMWLNERTRERSARNVEGTNNA